MADAAAQTVIIQVSSDGTHLVTGTNQTVYLYRPMQTDPFHKYIPWGDQFPGYMQEFILQWNPLIGTPKAGSGINQGDLSTITRGGKPDKAQQQIVYKGWWLYIIPGEAAGTLNPVEGQFELVSAKSDLLELPVAKMDDNIGSPIVPSGGP
jgi:hypothetical protein